MMIPQALRDEIESQSESQCIVLKNLVISHVVVLKRKGNKSNFNTKAPIKRSQHSLRADVEAV